jgi:hypothetical protein
MTASIAQRRRRRLKLAAIATLATAGSLAAAPIAAASGSAVAPSTTTTAGSAVRANSALIAGVQESPEVTYEQDGYSAPTCAGPSSALNYVVFYPSAPGPHPVVFGMSGSGFSGNAGCDSTTGEARYRSMDLEMQRWAAAGFVAVNIEYHGYGNGLYGDVTYPGPGNWGSVADGTVQLDIKPAIEYFFANDPAQYGADESQGVIAFGESSGAHDAYMLGVTGVPGHSIWAAVGWSGMPDASLSGSTAEGVFDDYMRTQPGTDVENFGDPEHRISPTAPPEYIANGSNEFIAAANAEQYFQTCTQDGIPLCYERIPNTSAHASGYEDYVFTGSPPEITDPAATPGQTVFDDTLGFVTTVLHGGPPPPPPPAAVAPAISAMSISPHKAWLMGVKVKAVCVRRTTQRQGRACKLPIKLKVGYTLNVADSVILKVERKTGGRRVDGKCVAQTRKNRTHRFCWRWVKLRGRRTLTGKVGQNSYTFNAKIGGHRLTPGKYLLTLTPTGGTSQQAAFTIFFA